jgi:hypothetical protein
VILPVSETIQLFSLEFPPFCLGLLASFRACYCECIYQSSALPNGMKIAGALIIMAENCL